jgi:hypothetical protein
LKPENRFCYAEPQPAKSLKRDIGAALVIVFPLFLVVGLYLWGHR